MLLKMPCLFKFPKNSYEKTITFQIPTLKSEFDIQKIYCLIDELNNYSAEKFYLICEEDSKCSYLTLIVNKLSTLNKKIIVVFTGPKILNDIECIKRKVESLILTINDCDTTIDCVEAFKRTKQIIDVGIPIKICVNVSTFNFNKIELIISEIKKIGIFELYFTLFTKIKNHSEVFNKNQKSILEKIKKIEKICKNNDINIVIEYHHNLGEINECRGVINILHINAEGKIFPCPYIEKSPISKKFFAQWQEGNLVDCIEKIQMFNEINNIRYGVFRQNSCLARACIWSKSEHFLSSDPLIEIK